MARVSVVAPGAQHGGVAVTSGTLHMPRVGAWTSKLRGEGDGLPAGRVDLRLGEQLVLAGTVARGATVETQHRLWIVAGAGGLTRLVRPKHYTSPTIAVVLRDLLRDVGEALAPSSDPQVLAVQLRHWTSIARPAGPSISWLLEQAGADVVWRHLPDGTVWVGRETWPVSKVADVMEGEPEPQDDRAELALLSPELLPGTALEDGRRIDSLEVQLGGEFHATAWFAT